MTIVIARFAINEKLLLMKHSLKEIKLIFLYVKPETSNFYKIKYFCFMHFSTDQGASKR